MSADNLLTFTPPMAAHRWQPEDHAHLARIAGTVPIDQVAGELGRTICAVRIYAHQHGIRLKYRPVRRLLLVDVPTPPVFLPEARALAERVGLSVAEVAFWLPRLPPGLSDLEVEAKLGQIAELIEDLRPKKRAG